MTEKTKEERISDFDNAPGGNYRAGLVLELAGAEAKLAIAKTAGGDTTAAEVAVNDVKAELARVGVTSAQIAAHRAETRV